MKPLHRRIRPDDAFPELDARLRAEANAARREPPPALRLRILAALRAEREARPAGAARPGFGLRGVRAPRLAAAAVVVVLLGLWTAFRLPGPRNERGEVAGGQDIVRPLRSLLHPETPRLLAEADHALVAEAQALWSDTSNVARGIVRRLPLAARLGSPPGAPGDAVPVESERR